MSDKTQPLDVGLYRPFKSAIKLLINEAAHLYDLPPFEQFDLLHIIRRAYEKSFTTKTIVRAFEKSGIRPVNGDCLWRSSRPRSADNVDVMMTRHGLEVLLEHMSARLRAGACIQPVVLKHGKVNTEQGLVVTGSDARDMVHREEERIGKEKEAQVQKEAQKAALEDQKDVKRHAER